MTSHPFEGLQNFRDTGGLPCEDGGYTQFGRLYRSEAPQNLTDAGMAAFIAHGVGRVIDLRTSAERQEMPSVLADTTSITHVHAPLFEDHDKPPFLLTRAGAYISWFDARAEGIRGALTAIADTPKPPVMVHCFMGKDRTGVVVALVLRLAGVRIDAIVDDYVQTGVALRDWLQAGQQEAVNSGIDAHTAEATWGIDRESMEHTVLAIDNDYGGIDSLMKRMGVDAERVSRLRQLMRAETFSPADFARA